MPERGGAFQQIVSGSLEMRTRAIACASCSREV
jgi:hypothetical protein